MLIVTMRELFYMNDDDTHTVTYSKICKELTEYSPSVIDAALTESIEDAVKIIRYDIIRFIDEHFKEYGIQAHYSDFKFQIHYNKIENGRVDLRLWFWDKETYDVEVEQ